MAVADYAHAIRKLLPSGKAWEFITSPGDFVWDTLLTALGGEPQRIEDDAYLLLEKVLPDNASTDLDLWETIVGAPDEELTTAERLARIRGLLFGPPDVNLSSLQSAIRAMSGDVNVALLNRAYPPAAIGACNAGDSVASGEWDFTWACELYPTVTGMTDPDTFSGFWSGFSAFTSQDQQSPVTLLNSASSATLPASPSAAVCNLTTVANDDTVRASIWVYPVTAFSLEIGIVDRAGAEQSDTYSLVAGVWHKVETQQAAGTGASTVQLFLRRASGTGQCYLSWCVAHLVDSGLESRITPLFPVHTRGVFGAQGEFATILAHEDQLEVCF